MNKSNLKPMNRLPLLIPVFAMFLGQMVSCTDDEFNLDPAVRLEFSLDTLTFDTVFTSVGSATRRFKVYNRTNQKINITRVHLEGLAGSTFRLNVDGTAGNAVTDVEIPANDSIYVFAEVTIDPNDQNSPFVVDDAVWFETNGNLQKVTLEAWGQNAYYLGSKGGGVLYSCELGSRTWDNSKPYVIYGILVIDSCEVILPPGTRIYVHGGLVNPDAPYNDGILFVRSHARLVAQGTKQHPVVIRGDRLEADFDEEPGQWAGILLESGSVGNELTFTTIRNSIVGVRVDSAAQLTLRHATIHNTNSSNLLGIHATIYAENCLFFSSNSQNNVQLEYGGNYTFKYCTMATFSEVPRISHRAPALRASNVLCLDEFCQDFRENALHASFENCVVFGSRKDEVQIFDRTETGNFNLTLDHCLIRLDEAEPDNDPIFQRCSDCVLNEDPLFVDIYAFDYRPDTLSPVIGRGVPLTNLTNQPILLDLDLNLRKLTNPDLGAYEYQD